MPLPRLAVAATLALAILLLGPPAADACSFIPPPQHTLDVAEQAVDTTPPTAPGAVAVTRGRGPEQDGCSMSSTSCDDLGWAVLDITPATDDRTDAEHMGYRLTLVAGSLPADMRLPAGPVRGHQLTLVWIDGADDEQERVDFTLEVRAMDLAGNEGDAVTVRVQHPGSEVGCRSGGGGLGGAALSLALLALLALRARVRRRPAR